MIFVSSVCVRINFFLTLVNFYLHLNMEILSFIFSLCMLASVDLPAYQKTNKNPH